jgi:hypothetical protein
VDITGAMRRRAVVLAVVGLALGVGSAVAGGPRTITVADSGKTFVVRPGAKIALRLSGQWVWSDPRTRSASVHLTPIEYFRYPGFQEWTVAALQRGRATIVATGQRPDASTRRFRVTIVVRR